MIVNCCWSVNGLVLLTLCCTACPLPSAAPGTIPGRPRCARANLPRTGAPEPPCPGWDTGQSRRAAAGRGSLPSGRCRRRREGTGPAPRWGRAGGSARPSLRPRQRLWGSAQHRPPPPVAAALRQGGLSRRGLPVPPSPARRGGAGGARLSPGPVLCPLPPFSLPPSLPPPRPRAARPPAPPAAGAAPYGPRRCHEPGPGSPRR